MAQLQRLKSGRDLFEEREEVSTADAYKMGSDGNASYTGSISSSNVLLFASDLLTLFGCMWYIEVSGRNLGVF